MGIDMLCGKPYSKTRTVLRLIVYIFFILLLLCYTAAVGFDCVRYAICTYEPLGSACRKDGFRTDVVWNRENVVIVDDKERLPTNNTSGTFATLLTIGILFYFSGLVSLIIVWLVDMRKKPNVFTRLVQYFSAAQVCMDTGFLISAGAMDLGMYKISSGILPPSNSTQVLYSIGVQLLAFGDLAGVLVTILLAYTFYCLSVHKGEADITLGKRIRKYAFVIFAFSAIMAILEKVTCSFCFGPSSCWAVTTRGALTLLALSVNTILLYLSLRNVAEVPEGPRKDALNALISRMWFYIVWVFISRLGYLYLTLVDGNINLNFADKERDKFSNVMSSLTWLLWLPSGYGFGLYYLYTHKEEMAYFWDTLARKPGAYFWPDDLRNYLFSDETVLGDWCLRHCARATEIDQYVEDEIAWGNENEQDTVGSTLEVQLTPFQSGDIDGKIELGSVEGEGAGAEDATKNIPKILNKTTSIGRVSAGGTRERPRSRSARSENAFKDQVEDTLIRTTVNNVAP